MAANAGGHCQPKHSNKTQEEEETQPVRKYHVSRYWLLLISYCLGTRINDKRRTSSIERRGARPGEAEPAAIQYRLLFAYRRRTLRIKKVQYPNGGHPFLAARKSSVLTD